MEFCAMIEHEKTRISKKVDMLCILGRGIEKVEEQWIPTQYIARRSKNNEHLGIRAKEISANDDDPRIFIAGGECNVFAASVLFKRWQEKGRVPQIVTFAAGRPPYLSKESDSTLSEGKILKEYFLARVDLGETKIVEQSHNQNSWDDIVETLELARVKKLATVCAITVLVHIPRCREILRQALQKNPQFRSVEMYFCASEFVLLDHSPNFAFLWDAMISKAFVRTADYERRAIRTLKESA
ncbi:MAG: hypothetical protein HY435_01735 [Candidatus Liptonbacteria bacterium]|nr:hypothetical protein [Candidatus Liptonbacteria bacterium]